MLPNGQCKFSGREFGREPANHIPPGAALIFGEPPCTRPIRTLLRWAYRLTSHLLDYSLCFIFYKSNSFQIILVQFDESHLIFFQSGFQMAFYDLAHIEIIG
jgi:hypothetical protein